MKREQTTFIRGPFWNYFCRTHNIALNDVVTFTLIRPKAQVGGEEDEDEEGSGEGAQEDMQQEDINVEEGSGEGAQEDMQ